MDKKMKYWIVGIGAVAIVLIIWFAVARRAGGSEDVGESQSSVSNSQKDGESGSQKSSAESSGGMSGSMDHSSHGMSSQNESADKNLKEYLKEQDRIMADMMDDMGNIPTSGDASIDFLSGMIPHHESAVAMAESLLRYGGENSEIKKLAEDIIKQQTGEIEQMNTMIKKLEESGSKDKDREEAYLKEYNKMMGDSHHMSSSEASSVDAAFAEGMIMHHEMAIDMAQAILDYTDSQEVKELAENIIELQKEEIKQMQELLDNL